MFVFLCAQAWSFYVRKAMVAMMFAWLACFFVMVRMTNGFPILALVFLVAGMCIVPFIFLNYTSFRPHYSPHVDDDIGVIGGGDGPTYVWITEKFGPFTLHVDQEMFQRITTLHAQRIEEKKLQAR